jgi:hypothetical protein
MDNSKKRNSNTGADPTLPFGEPTQVGVAELMDFPGKKGMYPNGKAAESFRSDQNQNPENEGYGGR